MKLAALSLILFATTLFAQTTKLPKKEEPTPTGAPMKTWNLRADGSMTLQYDPAAWKEVEDTEAAENDNYAPTFLVPADGTQFVALRATYGGGGDSDVTFKDHTQGYIDSLKDKRNILILDVGGFTTGSDAAIFVAYIQEPADQHHIAFAVYDWMFPGDKNDVDSHSGILIEGLAPAIQESKKAEWLDKFEFEVKTFKRNPVTPAKGTEVPKK